MMQTPWLRSVSSTLLSRAPGIVGCLLFMLALCAMRTFGACEMKANKLLLLLLLLPAAPLLIALVNVCVCV
jgi:hypothetical protein